MAVDARTVTRKARFGVLGVGALALTAAALTFGAGTAGADPNDPAHQEFSPDGQVRSSQAASVSGSEPCVTSTGTAGTSDVRVTDVSTPKQTASEAGPEWVGSDGWQASGLTRSNPWGGAFDPRNVGTGPQCSPVTASGF
ncbi:hypothetical protein [Mycolicibacterium duvalii]|uniref:Uncharacterized protein n=1 Tax=Mycolicibacterium duvalii TaxID=39688 RepID=A0A7I7KAR4_9MYCO|nr:hypothetical protein [Mycolicibacterium duvalii]MCV7368351.1 hypothetical protein [Mycolicibacterium duvalii]BBX20452.1 hypothetical protein MDUV_53120 [Mycolicibacterium duvalii]